MTGQERGKLRGAGIKKEGVTKYVDERREGNIKIKGGREGGSRQGREV